MDFTYPEDAERFREEVRAWLTDHLTPEFARLGYGMHANADEWATESLWEQELGKGNWIGLTWPQAYGGREVSVLEELVFAEEYVRAGAPFRAGFVGENLLGPTLIAFGADEHRRRFLPPILDGTEYWCQGFSEPDAGSDLANVRTRAALDGGRWRIDGQKLWTGQAQHADWIFVLCRTTPDSARNHGLSLLLVPMDQPGIEIRPIVEMTGNPYFCEVYFDGALTDADLIVGAPGDGWKVAMGTLGFERGTAFLAQQLRFAREYRDLVALAQQSGATRSPGARQRLAAAYIGLEIIRFSGYRTITSVMHRGQPGPEASLGKLQWSTWHRDLGELAMDVAATDSLLDHDRRTPLGLLQQMFLFSRADTIYAGASEIQRTIIAERVLGLPREPDGRQR